MARVADISIGDIRRAGARYRPVALTVAAIMGVVWAFPAPAGLDRAAGPVARAPLAQAGTGGAGGTGGGCGTEASEPAAVEAPEPTMSEFSFEASGPTTVAAPYEVAVSSSPPAYSPPPASESVSSSYEGETASELGAPLTVIGSAWASAQAGTPLAGTGVPEGSLPVGVRLGGEDKVSFVRLVGTETLLTLKEHPGGTRDVAGDPVVQMCKVLEAGWEEAEAMSFDDAPAWHPDYCVDGERSEDGTWTFDLSAFPDRADEYGFALVPGPDAPIDFQVAFTA